MPLYDCARLCGCAGQDDGLGIGMSVGVGTGMGMGIGLGMGMGLDGMVWYGMDK